MSAHVVHRGASVDEVLQRHENSAHRTHIHLPRFRGVRRISPDEA